MFKKKQHVFIFHSLFLSHQPFVIYDVETLWKAESGLVWSQLVPGAPLTKEIGVHVFYRCQCTTVETVRELTEFAKCIPGFVDLYLNDQVGCFIEPKIFKCCIFEKKKNVSSLDFSFQMLEHNRVT